MPTPNDLYQRYSPARVNYHINLSIKHDFMYFETPKAGCSTIKGRLHKLEIGDNRFVTLGKNIHDKLASPFLSPYQVKHDEFRKILNNRAFLKFTFVRNPFTRTLSAYLDKIVRNEPQKQSITRTMGLGPDETTREISFEDFLRAVDSQSDKEMDPHWAIQSHHLMLDLIDYNFIGRLENFENDWNIAVRMVYPKQNRENPPSDIQTHHKTDASKNLTEYYSAAAIDLVRKIYADDFEQLGYSREIDSIFAPAAIPQ